MLEALNTDRGVTAFVRLSSRLRSKSRFFFGWWRLAVAKLENQIREPKTVDPTPFIPLSRRVGSFLWGSVTIV